MMTSHDRHCADAACPEGCGCACANDEVEAIREFVALEDDKLALLESAGDVARTSGNTPVAVIGASQHLPEDMGASVAAAPMAAVRLSGEERPRPMVPSQARLAAGRNGSGEVRLADGVSGSREALTAMLATEPRALRLPDPLR
jgi:hypothetical protein